MTAWMRDPETHNRATHNPGTHNPGTHDRGARLAARRRGFRIGETLALRPMRKPA